MMNLWGRIKNGAAEGLVFSVKWTVALFAIVFFVLWALQNINVVRLQASHGEEAYQTLVKIQQANQAKLQAPPK
jgi:hypothetical protein